MGRKRKTHPSQDPHQPSAPSYAVDESSNLNEHGYDNAKDYGQSLYYSDNSPVSKSRSCTDVLCLLLFFAFLGGWGFVAYLGIQGGDIIKVIYPTDSQGNVCGQGSMKDRPNLMIFDLTQCLNPAVLVSGCNTPHVCVAACPRENYTPLGLASVGGDQEDIKARMKPYCAAVTEEAFKARTVKQLIVEDQVCPPWYLESTPLFGRCFPSIVTVDPAKTSENTGIMNNAATREAVVVGANDTLDRNPINAGNLTVAVSRLTALLNVREVGERVFSDLAETWWMIGLSLLGACVLSFVWICLMRFLAGVMVWTSIMIVFLGVGGLMSYCGYRLYFVWVSTDPEALKNILEVNLTPYYLDDVLKLRDTWLAFTIILGIIFLIIVCIFIFLRTRILIAIALIEQGSKAVGQMFSSLFFPIIPFILQMIVVGWFLIIAMYLASSGRAEYRVTVQPGNCDQVAECLFTDGNGTRRPYATNDTCSEAEFSACANKCPGAACQFVRYTENKDFSWLQVANVFGLYWGVFFFSAFGEMVLAGVFAQWYWTRDKSRVPAWTLARSMWNTTVFHLGTIAFGSLILAIIRMIRTMLEYVEKKLKGFNNDLTRCLLCCCKCCLYCLEKFMRFINRNAYIMCAMKSSNFCSSARQAFNLLMRNLVRVVVLDSVCDFLLFLGKMVIVLSCGIVSYLSFGGYIPEIKDDIPNLNYFFTPIVCIVVGSYLIASCFFGVYSMAVDTLFLCFLEDLERNDGTPEKPYYMSKSLKSILGKMEKTAAQRDQVHHHHRP